VDVDLIDDFGNKVEIKDVAEDIEFRLGRMKVKDPQAVSFQDIHRERVNTQRRVDFLKRVLGLT